MDGEACRVLVVGDSGVGKTCLVHLICRGAPLNQPRWTVGCSVDVMCRRPAELSLEGGGGGDDQFVEFVDVSGSDRYARSRRFLYRSIDALLLVYDVSNLKSYHNLARWADEVFLAGARSGALLAGGDPSTTSASSFDAAPPEGSQDGARVAALMGACPCLLVGNKADALSAARRREFRPPPARGALRHLERRGMEAVLASAQRPATLGPDAGIGLERALEALRVRALDARARRARGAAMPAGVDAGRRAALPRPATAAAPSMPSHLGSAALGAGLLRPSPSPRPPPGWRRKERVD
jgi:Rab-like protein 3